MAIQYNIHPCIDAHILRSPTSCRNEACCFVGSSKTMRNIYVGVRGLFASGPERWRVYLEYVVRLVGIFPVESLLLSNFSSCCFVVSRGGLAGISRRIFLIYTRVWYSLDHLEKSDSCMVKNGKD
jgi:hypothetical protein